MKLVGLALSVLATCASKALADPYDDYSNYLLARQATWSGLKARDAYAEADAYDEYDSDIFARDAYAEADADPYADYDEDLFVRDSFYHDLEARDALAEAEAEAEALAEKLAHLSLQRRVGSRPSSPKPGAGKSGSKSGSRPGSPEPKGTAAYQRMSQYKSDMQPGKRYIFKVTQPPKEPYPHGADMQAYCERKGYKHAFLLVGEVTADHDFHGKWWDLRKETTGKGTSPASEPFDASKGKSLVITYAGTTSKSDASISGFGKSSSSPMAKNLFNRRSYSSQCQPSQRKNMDGRYL